MIVYKVVPMLPPYDTLADGEFVAEVRRQLPHRMLAQGQAIRSVETVELITDPGVLLAHHAEHHDEAPCYDGCRCADDVGMLAKALAFEQLRAVAIAEVDAVPIGRDS